MPHIPLNPNLPGVTGLLDYRLDTALPIRHLTQILLRGESTLTEGERELIATVVSDGNECRFCTAAHTAAANAYLHDPSVAEQVKADISTCRCK
ncbi:carboxymuconolactone decarboxylase family protein [Puia sp. P3]|uniref:carboxymuconolactone decarboxylase family protein n=1 Tax=Puia sp. P3 TaxID=3423952 RepID=UPI003D6688CB